MQRFSFLYLWCIHAAQTFSTGGALTTNEHRGSTISSSTTGTCTSSRARDCLGRREWATTSIVGIVSAGLTSTVVLSSPTPVQATVGGLAAKLASRDPSALSNSVFNVPPPAQIYPEFMRGTWDVQVKFGGFLFPSQKISKQRITQNILIPGFQKCSIAALCDVGKENTSYRMTIDPTTGYEDRISTLTSQINGGLGYPAVQQVLYNPKTNPNRLSIDFVDYQTTNAERIELFCNARESESVIETGVFVCSEYLRQVTFGTGSEVGIPRQVIGNYAHFWTWRPSSSNNSNENNDDNGYGLKGNLLTAAYLDPQDATFFEEPTKPVAVYSHILTATKVV